MKDFIYNEMMVHVAVCTNKNPENVLIISSDASGLENEMKKHTEMKTTVIAADINALRELNDGDYDVVISELDSDAAVLAHLNRILKDDGVIVSKHPHLDNIADNKSMMQVLAKYAIVIMPFNIGNGETALLASKQYHPTADIILHRTDMLDGLEYYNCDVHPAAFAMGNNVRKAYLGVIKN